VKVYHEQLGWLIKGADNMARPRDLLGMVEISMTSNVLEIQRTAGRKGRRKRYHSKSYAKRELLQKKKKKERLYQLNKNFAFPLKLCFHLFVSFIRFILRSTLPYPHYQRQPLRPRFPLLPYLLVPICSIYSLSHFFLYRQT